MYYISSRLIVIQNFARTQAHILLSHTIETLHEGQGHSNWHHTVQQRNIYHPTNFELERNQLVDFRTKAGVTYLPFFSCFFC